MQQIAYIAIIAVFLLAVLKKDKFWALCLTLLSYAYCLPVIQWVGPIGHTELRLYDIFLFLFLFSYGLENNFNFASVFKTTQPSAIWLKRFLGMCLVGLGINYIAVGDKLVLATAIVRWLRMFGYVSVYFFIFKYIKRKEEVKKLLFVFVASAIVVVGGAIAQSQGLIPLLWPAIYYSEGVYDPGHAFTFTLSPHHRHIALYAFLGVMVLVAYLKSSRLGIQKIMLPLFLGMASYLAIVNSSRGGLVIFILYILLSLLQGKKRLTSISVVFIGLYLMSSIYSVDIVSSIEKFSEQQETTLEEKGVNKLASGRIYIWSQGIEKIRERPWMLFTGSGFQSAGHAKFYAVFAMHNLYLHILMELGIGGLLIFLFWVHRIFKELKQRYREAGSRETKHYVQEFKIAFQVLLFACLTTDALYPQRAMFSFFGTFLFLAALALHPALTQDNPPAQ